jgi:hypothetical protein
MKGEQPGAVTTMTAMPPEPDLSSQAGHAAPTRPLPIPPPSGFPSGPAFPSASDFSPPPVLPPPPDPSAQDLAGPAHPHKIGPRRLIAGVLWAVIAGICAAGAVGEWLVGLHGAAVLCLVIAVGSGWFDFRIWVPRRRRSRV